jgi:hypothetical protein
MLMSPKITMPGCTDTLRTAEMMATTSATPHSQVARFCSRSMACTRKSFVSSAWAMFSFTLLPCRYP